MGTSFAHLGLNDMFRVTATCSGNGIRRHSSNMQDVSAEPVERVSATTGLGGSGRQMACCAQELMGGRRVEG